MNKFIKLWIFAHFYGSYMSCSNEKSSIKVRETKAIKQFCHNPLPKVFIGHNVFTPHLSKSPCKTWCNSQWCKKLHLLLMFYDAMLANAAYDRNHRR